MVALDERAGRVEVGVQRVEQADDGGLVGVRGVPVLPPMLEDDSRGDTAHVALFEYFYFIVVGEPEDGVEQDIDELGDIVRLADQLVGLGAKPLDVGGGEFPLGITVDCDRFEAVMLEGVVHSLGRLHGERVIGVEVDRGVDILEVGVSAEHEFLIPLDEFPRERHREIAPFGQARVVVHEIAGLDDPEDTVDRILHMLLILVVLFPHRYAEHEYPPEMTIV